MALYITVPGMPDLEWHVGKSTDNARQIAEHVTEVQADGHELEHIRDNFMNLPTANRRVVRWHGEMAKFIVGNL